MKPRELRLDGRLPTVILSDGCGLSQGQVRNQQLRRSRRHGLSNAVLAQAQARLRLHNLPLLASAR